MRKGELGCFGVRAMKKRCGWYTGWCDCEIWIGDWKDSSLCQSFNFFLQIVEVIIVLLLKCLFKNFAHMLHINIYKGDQMHVFSLFLLSLKIRVGVLPPTLLSPLHLLPFLTHIFPSPTHVNTKFVSFICFPLGYIIIFKCIMCVCVCVYIQYPYTQLFWPFFCFTKEYFAYFFTSCFSYSTVLRGNVSKSIELAYCRLLNKNWHD